MDPKIPFSLAGLAKAGQAAAPGALPEGVNPEVVPGAPVVNPPVHATPAPAIYTASPAGAGHIKIFPPQYATLAELPAGWTDANWSGPSPWCRIEGQPDHPDFEANLKAWENS